jgi:hypothetical protein
MAPLERTSLREWVLCLTCMATLVSEGIAGLGRLAPVQVDASVSSSARKICARSRKPPPSLCG